MYKVRDKGTVTFTPSIKYPSSVVSLFTHCGSILSIVYVSQKLDVLLKNSPKYVTVYHDINKSPTQYRVIYGPSVIGGYTIVLNFTLQLPPYLLDLISSSDTCQTF